ncbi:MAG: aldo/keto reductase [Planctomycetaceae bacterium]|jgi:aryl-alcohol dehydrogenase-like predicted oxidoreductase|nr:aldo/keto reductase [Planctomycetaceae bacterium]MBT6483601.1 aldo/keto reductase [Planctomycetaceae bacterium]MBT6496165.1 aldo/keto reductase [Planctomycetaceae bacterium]
MKAQTLGQTGLKVSPIGFGAFKIGRNQKIKYPTPYDLPTEADVEKLLNAVLDMGITYIDTAPAYGLSEERIGRSIAHRRAEFVLSTKIGETFRDGESQYDYSTAAVRESIDRSRRLFGSEMLDLVFIHSNGDDDVILNHTDAVATLCDLKQAGTIRAIAMSAKTVEGTRQSLEWADVVMVEYHLDDRSHEEVIAEAAARGVGVVVKKGLAAGHLAPDEAIGFVLRNPHVGSIVIGGLNPAHIQANVHVAATISRG